MKRTLIALVLTVATLASAQNEAPGRDWLLGFERTKVATPEALLDAINYLRMQLRSHACTTKAGFTTLTVKNHLWDYPNSKRYLGFAWVRLPAPVAPDCQKDIDAMKGWFESLGMETVTVTPLPEAPVTVEKRIPIGESTLFCGLDKPHFPTGYALVVDGRHLWSSHVDKCEAQRRLLSEAQAQGGTLVATITTSRHQVVDFTNTGNTTGDVRLRWKLVTVTPITVTVGGITFTGAGYDSVDIAHE